MRRLMSEHVIMQNNRSNVHRITDIIDRIETSQVKYNDN